jgi:dTDP-glucose 4,6-dehydratase
MKYFVTGGAGFIGSNYVRMLLTGMLGEVDSVTVIDNLTYAGNLKNLELALNDPRFTFIEADISDKQAVTKHLKTEHILVNFAAESHVDNSIKNPKKFLETNILGTQNLLEVSMQKEIKLFVQISTDEVYGSIEKGSTDEQSNLRPNSPYAASKASADLIVRSYVNTFGLDARITRCSNNYGLNQHTEKFIPNSISKLLKNEKIPIYGDGSNIREWIHVEDHCRGIDVVIKNGSAGEIYNIGSGFEINNLELAKLIIQKFDKSENDLEYVADRKGHDVRYSLDFSKISKIGFECKHTFSKGLSELIETLRKQKIESPH